MELTLIFQIISTSAVILGILFGILNLRNFQTMRKREAAILMLNSFQTTEFVRGLLLVFSIPKDMVDDAFSGPILTSWEKLAAFVLQFRSAVNRDTGFEWFQWLAERMMERERTTSAIPAYIAHKKWKSK